MIARKARFFWPILLAVTLADCGTKQLAVDYLAPQYVPHPVIGEVVRFTLAYNQGAAMSTSLGEYSRIGFSLLALGVLVLLGRLYRRAEGGDVRLAVALALVCGGAVGNLLDRLRSPLGVVDFIDVGVGSYRFWIFNLADVGVTVGAAALAVLIWRREAQQAAAATPGPASRQRD